MSEDREELFREVAHRLWVVSPLGIRLHNPVSFDCDGWTAVDVVFACGLRAAKATIPTSMRSKGIPRCQRCCEQSDISRGWGSPKQNSISTSLGVLDGAPVNEYGTPVSVRKCTACGFVFTVCPADTEGIFGSECLDVSCPSYDISRDVDIWFEPALEAGLIRRLPS